MHRRLNVSIDDVSPHPLSSLDVICRCNDVLAVHPDVKFTLFVPTAYWRTVYTHGKIDTRTPQPLELYRFPEFCEQLAALPQATYEVGYHGRFHGVVGVSNNDEFRGLGYDVAMRKFELMFNDVRRAGLENIFKPIFRPPAMYMSVDAIRAARSSGIKCLALSPRHIHTKTYGGAHVGADDVVMANVWPPDVMLSECSDERIEALYHACEWDGGHLNTFAASELTKWITSEAAVCTFIGDLYDG